MPRAFVTKNDFFGLAVTCLRHDLVTQGNWK
jgi:hypothetical protein